MSSTVTEPTVILTESAAAQIQALLEKEADRENKGFRVYVEPGGCSGKQYGMVFDEPRPGDIISGDAGVRVLVDPVSLDHLRGAKIDFVESLTGGGFKITNPRAKQSCGCGKSFETG